MNPTDAGESTRGAAPSDRSPVRAKVRTALGCYVLSTVLASAALLVAQPRSGIDSAALSLVQFGPVLGALATWSMYRKTVTGLPFSAVPVRRVLTNVATMAVACVSFWLLITAGAVVWGVTPVGPAAVGTVPFAVFLLLQLLGATGEEIGWRGLMQPLLQSRMSRFAAICVTGTAWALWHVQAFTAGAPIAISFFVAVLAFAAVLGSPAEGSFRQRVLVAAIGHWLINIAWYLLAGDDTSDRPQIVFVAIAAVLVAAGVTTVRRRGPRPPARPRRAHRREGHGPAPIGPGRPESRSHSASFARIRSASA
ncbi:CPBP family intramembrane glutamic endopeptidase [Nocardia aurantia]|uniref:CPBP family intramembrane glutamic endopeptidase n=1 Tax=Nocardia aurantia TaxID=2585199 RepID=UPI001885EF4D|nr:type II CAAX endopeptidase family protein [Nocardia aurantia]